MGSTVSPVSSRSRTSGLLGRQHSKTRKSNFELVSSGQKTTREVPPAKPQTQTTNKKEGDSSSPIEPSSTTQNRQPSPHKSLKSGEYTAAAPPAPKRNLGLHNRNGSLDNEIHVN